MSTTDPPRLASRLLAALLPEDAREEVLGDLQEALAAHVRRSGHAAAVRWYLREAVTLPVWLWWGKKGDLVVTTGNDFRVAVRSLRRSPLFTGISVTTLGLGLGATLAIFGVVHGVLLSPLPYPSPDRLVTIGHTTRGGDLPPRLPSSTAAHFLYVDASRSFSSQALYQIGESNLTGKGAPQRVQVTWATASLFPVLGEEPALGRPFGSEEDRPGGPDVVVVSHRFWQEQLGGDPEAVGRAIVLDGRPREVVAVMPERFGFPDREVFAWLPMKLARTDLGGFNVPAIARLRPGVSAERAERELRGVLPRIVDLVDFLSPEMLASTGLAPEVRPYRDELVGEIRPTLWILLGAVGCVLLIACVNVANLVLVRGEGRQREVAVRRALGAGRSDLWGKDLAEGAVIAALGTGVGLALATGALQAFVSLGGDLLRRVDSVGVTFPVVALAMVLGGLTALGLGALPAWRRRDQRLAQELRAGSRAVTSGAAGLRGRQLLVGGQVAVALLLLVGSGLLVRSFWELRRVDPGFVPEGVLSFEVALPLAIYPRPEEVAAFHARALEKLRALPGIEAAGALDRLPLSGYSSLVDPLNAEGRPSEPGRLPFMVEMRAATPGAFTALRVPLLAGRPFEERDSLGDRAVVVVSRTAAERLFPGEPAVGRRVAHGVPGTEEQRAWSEIVGVVGDIRGVSLTEEPIGAVYYPQKTVEGVDMSWLSRDLCYLIRSSLPPEALLPGIRAAVAEIDPNLPVADPLTLTAVVAQAESRMRITLGLLLAAAAVGLALGAVGLFGVVSYVTTQRSREIGVRIALGAGASAVRRLVLRQAVRVVLAGMAAGVVAALLLGRYLATILYQVPPHDAWTFVAVCSILLAVSLAATWLPAWRASRADPARVLREG